MKNKKKGNILLINEYCLLKIFDYCCQKDLENLYLTCKLFRDLIEFQIYRRKSRDLLMTGWEAELNNKRNFSTVSYRSRIKMNENWLSARYKENIYFKHHQFFSAKVQVVKDIVLISHAEFIRFYQKNKKEPIQRRFFKEISSIKSDISDFVKKNNYLFAGQGCGNCFLYDVASDEMTEQRLHTPDEYLANVDFCGDFFVTNTNRKSKLWKKVIELGLVNFELVRDSAMYYKSAKFDQNGQKLYCGMWEDLRKRKALREIDIETGSQTVLNSNTFSIYDIQLKDDNCLLTAHFDTTFRLFDRRTNSDELIFTDPYDSSVYCLNYDGLNGVVCGMKYNSRVNLYDLRVPEKFIQMYFAANSPYSSVHSIASDLKNLYFTTDHDLRVFEFNADWAPSKDFRNIFVNL